jgi:hypothetical protein
MGILSQNDGIHGMLPRELMCESVRKLRDTYERKPDTPIFQNEFGFFCFDRWQREGFLEGKHDEWNLEWDDYLRDLFGFDMIGHHALMGMAWGTAAFSSAFEEKIIEDRGDYEVVQDFAGRHVLFFKGRRNGFMPEYLDHPVKDMRTWKENCQWRLDPKDTARFVDLEINMKTAVEKAKKGYIIEQMVTGGYMYLRSLIGPLELLYKFHDEPELIHECMQNWLELADVVTAKHQEYVTFDELFISEDICFNQGAFISPDMIREFLFPYYQQLITNIKRRQIDKNRHLHFQVDSDGHSVSIIKLYEEIGMDYLSPFEVASGCDVVAIGRENPELIMRGGIDKRVLAESRDAIDRHLDNILPVMRRRGGYIPTCDHGVPDEVSFENYMYYRKRCLEYSK